MSPLELYFTAFFWGRGGEGRCQKRDSGAYDERAREGAREASGGYTLRTTTGSSRELTWLDGPYFKSWETAKGLLFVCPPL